MGLFRLFKPLEDHEPEVADGHHPAIRRVSLGGSGSTLAEARSRAVTPKDSTYTNHSAANRDGPGHHHHVHVPEVPLQGSSTDPDPSWDPNVFGENENHKWKYLQVSSHERFPSSTSLGQVSRWQETKKWRWMLLQATVPLLLAGCSLIFAGYFLLTMQKTPAFLRWRELTVLVTPLLGIKSQLELTSVARFTMHLTVGNMPKSERLEYCIADMAVSLVQAVLAAICSGYFAMFLVWIREDMPYRYGNSDIWIILAVSCCAACVTCVLTTVITMIATLICFKYRVDPNNVAVPIVACIGDISTLGFLDLFARLFQEYEALQWLAPLTTVLIMVAAVLLAFVAYRHPHTRSSLWACWFPILLVVILSCFAGMLLEFEGREFDNMELYQPLITGVTGTIIAMHYATISSDYFRYCKPGILPVRSDGKPGHVCFLPTLIFCPKRIQTRTYILLLGITVPAHALFSVLIWGFVPSHSKNCYGIFFTLYVVSCFIQSVVLLYLAHVLLNFLWKMRIDPAFYVISTLHAFGDILGTFFLLLCCQTYKIESCISQ